MKVPSTGNIFSIQWRFDYKEIYILAPYDACGDISAYSPKWFRRYTHHQSSKVSINVRGNIDLFRLLVCFIVSVSSYWRYCERQHPLPVRIDTHVQLRSQQIESIDKEALRSGAVDSTASSSRQLTYLPGLEGSVQSVSNTQSENGPFLDQHPYTFQFTYLSWTFPSWATKISHLIKRRLRTNLSSLYNLYRITRMTTYSGLTWDKC